MSLAVSPLAPAGFPDLPDIAGVDLFTGTTGTYKGGRDNVLLARFRPGTAVAGVLTRSQCASAPIEWCRQYLAQGTARGLVVNAGNANAFTGLKGAEATQTVAEHAAFLLGCTAGEVLLGSTGVIGEPLDPAPLMRVLDGMDLGQTGTMQAGARAIMTTDTFAKGAVQTVEIDGQTVTIAGFAKGSGMIAPDMATMLSFVFTDMAVAAPVLQALLSRHVKTSFNAITVDSDTSTSDTCLVFATGAADGVAALTDENNPRAKAFGDALHTVLLDLALQIVRDGEGASKFIKVAVTGATRDDSAEVIARSIANSPLIKTAIAGEDANWGRVVMAVGKAGQPADRDRLKISFGPHVVAEKGARSPTYSEAQVSAYMKGQELEISVDLGLGEGRAVIYTCDLTHGYVAINADYRS